MVADKVRVTVVHLPVVTRELNRALDTLPRRDSRVVRCRLQRLVPKFGFKNINRVEYKAINLSALQQLADDLGLATIDFQTFLEAGFVSKNDKVKILAKGELKSKLDVKAHAFSKTAKEAIEKLEGTTELI